MLDLIAHAALVWESRLHPRWDNGEVACTVVLVGLVRELIHQLDVDYWVESEVAELTPEMLRGEASPRVAGRADMKFLVLPPIGDRLTFVVECKRLGNDVLAAEFVAEGIDRFRRGKYQGERGGMLGYVQDGPPDEAHLTINSFLNQPEHLSPTPARQGIPSFASAHPTSSAELVKLGHVMIDLRSPGSPSRSARLQRTEVSS